MKLIVGLLIIGALGYVAYMQFATEPTSDAEMNTASESADMADADTTATEDSETTVSGDMTVDVTAPELDAEADVEAEATTRTFTLDSFSYGYSEEVIEVNEGDTVTINLTNSGGFHDWVVDEFDAATEKISEGETTSVTFVASEAGTYEYYCSVGSHREQGMVGTLIVR